MVNQCESDFDGCAMLKHVLPEPEVREKGFHMTLKIVREEVFGIGVGLHLCIVGQL